MIYLTPVFSNAKKRRRKNIGFYPLNPRMLGSEGHHINSEQVVYIPNDIHRGIPHDHKIPETMIQINRIALEYLYTGIGVY